MWENIVLIGTLCVLTFLVKNICSDKPNKIKFNFNFFIFYFLSSIISLLIFPLFLLSPRNVRNVNVVTKILKHITKIYDLKWDLRNGHILSEERGAIIVSNHQSTLDVLGMFNIWEVVGKMTVIAKKEVFYVWPFGLAAYFAGVIFIDRRDAKAAYQTLDNVASEIMIKNKTKVWLFPEGTRNKDRTKLLPFKKGAFVMAVRAQVPIIPVLFSPYYFINSKKYLFNRGHVNINCLEAVSTVGLTVDDVPDLIDRVHDQMQRAYAELSK